MDNISPEQAVERAKKIISTHDKETKHIKLDDLLLKIVRQFGYDELANIFENEPKWYA